MAGHSKWANIQHRKGRQDKLRAKLFTKLGKELTIAAREGGGNIEFNPRLRLALDKAKAGNMPKDVIERAVKKGTGELEGVEYVEIRYEGYGPAGVAFVVDVVTDNKNRSASTVRSNFAKNSGNLGSDGAVSWMFHKKAVFVFDANIDMDELMMVTLDAGAEDIVEEGDSIVVYGDYTDFHAINEVLKDTSFIATSSEITMVPENRVEITDLETAEKVMKLYDALDDNEDVQEVYSNFDISPEILDKIIS